MRIKYVPFEEFRKETGGILDVRSPSEYSGGHLPGAVNFPVFSDTERAAIGVCYKERGSAAAVELGFEIVGPKLVEIIRRAKDILPDQKVRLYCWRGGLRSGSLAWVLQTAGFRVRALDGGYRTYRRWVRQTLDQEMELLMLRGLTGTGKTRILHALQKLGEQVLDLEGVARHRGSSFGGLGLPAQPPTQMFENLIAAQLAGFSPARPIWIEAESRQIGTCHIPEELYKQMRNAEAFEIYRPLNERLEILTEMYGNLSHEDLIEATKRIRKKLGGQRTKDAVNFIRAGDLSAACAIILDYYDRCYNYDSRRRLKTVRTFDISGLGSTDVAKLLSENLKMPNRRKALAFVEKFDEQIQNQYGD